MTIYSATTNDYDAGSLEDGTGYLLSRAQAADSVNYLCENEQDMKVLKRGQAPPAVLCIVQTKLDRYLSWSDI